MAGRVSQNSHSAAIARVVQAVPDADLFRLHLQEIIESSAFKSSRRSLEFLSHIVEKSLQGQFDDLKERSLGVELFGRPASYDTGADAIVRVTASDVRRRLQQYYSEAGAHSELRIDLPSGSYIPEFRHVLQQETPRNSAMIETLPESPREMNRLWNPALYALLGFGILIGAWLWSKGSSGASSASETMPWSALLTQDRDLHIVFCDPDISLAQGLLGFRLSLSDYANQRYLPENLSGSPEALQIVRTLRGVNVASVDANTAIAISRLQPAERIRTHTARSLHILDFKTEDNFVLLGSPRSNPWFALFQDQLDFRFEHDPSSGHEIVRNHRMETSESPAYVPTAMGWATGEAYGIIALVKNANQKGHALLLAGSNAEATEAAGKLATNIDMLSQTLKRYGIDPYGTLQNFEILLRVSTMAGSPDKFEVIACHRLSDR